MKTAVARAMTPVCAVAALAAFSPAALGTAEPAAPAGVYAIEGGADGFFIVIRPHCVTEGCTADITSSRGVTGVATLTNGRWDFKVAKPDGVICDDGSYAPVVIDYSVDAATLMGVLTADSNGGCPGGQVTQAPFQLRKVGEAG